MMALKGNTINPEVDACCSYYYNAEFLGEYNEMDTSLADKDETRF
jgi:hypothetical protein